MIIKKSKDENEGNFITIVSGLPRSGTSMMMRMIKAGGIKVVTDNMRKSNEDNPRGYYEDERVKKMKKDSSWLGECQGKVVKIISMLLYNLLSNHNYKVIFMKREMQEILSSQKTMLRRRGEKVDDVSNQEMGDKFEKHLRQVEDWLKKQENIDVLYVRYNDVIDDAKSQIKTINRFLGNCLNEEEMVKVVEKSLYRQRKQ